jgi:ATP-dependent Clp protease ATP-binding subunit ClpA
MDRVRERVIEHDLQIELTQSAREYLADEGYNPEYGARPLRRVIQNQVEDALSDGLLAGQFEPGSTILIDCVDDELTFEAQETVQEPEPAA